MAEEYDVASVTTNIYGLLKPLESKDRLKVVKAALTLLDDGGNISLGKSGEPSDLGDGGLDDSLPSKFRSWSEKNGISEEHLSNTFHKTGDVVEVIISEAPGKGGKEKTLSAYILTGIAQFMATGEPKFEDAQARDVCKALGCLNESNHATYLKGKGNSLSGSKGSGWTLTAPGLKTGAEMIKQAAGE